MLAAIIPARNEAENLQFLYSSLSGLPFDKIITVVNGSNDNTLDVVLKQKNPNNFMIYFNKPLGVDIPRAIGAWKAYLMGCTGFCFIDGDLTGNIRTVLLDIISELQSGTDLALTNCYPLLTRRSTLTNNVLHFRGELNRMLDLYDSIGLASPSHGPHGISRCLLSTIPLAYLGVPPTLLVYAQKNNLKVKVASSFPHSKLGSAIKDNSHAIKMAHTIIGDCIEATFLAKREHRIRTFQNFNFDGYNSERRFDLLKEYSEVVPTITW